DCARQTGADVVTPLLLIGEPRDQIVHFWGGDQLVEETGGPRRMRDTYWHAGFRVADVAGELGRRPTDFSELHCTFVRRDLFERIGPFDESLRSCQEHSDFGLAVRKAGGSIHSEPASQVSFFDIGTFTLADVAFHGLRWSVDWVEGSVQHFVRKWNIARD